MHVLRHKTPCNIEHVSYQSQIFESSHITNLVAHIFVYGDQLIEQRRQTYRLELSHWTIRTQISWGRGLDPRSRVQYCKILSGLRFYIKQLYSTFFLFEISGLFESYRSGHQACSRITYISICRNYCSCFLILLFFFFSVLYNIG